MYMFFPPVNRSTIEAGGGVLADLPAFYGASASALAAANTTAFAALEAASPGASVDLNGHTYTVSAVPTGANYYNGGWQVSSTLYPAAYKKFANPFDAPAVTIARLSETSWPAGIWFDGAVAAQKLWRVEIVGANHSNTAGSRLEVTLSRDAGETWLERRTIFSSPTYESVRAAALGKMSSGRWGGIITVNALIDPTDRNHFFTYSDDSGATWTNTDITASVPDAEHFVYGPLMQGPTFASGDFMVLTYAGSEEIKRIRTTDNGANWADTVLKTETGLPGNPEEASEIYIPGKGWVMFVRTGLEAGGFFVVGMTYVIATLGTTDFTLIGAASNTVGLSFVATGAGSGTGTAQNPNIWSAKSADGLTYGDWVDTGTPVGRNPIHALYDGGRAHITVVQRSGYTSTTRGNVMQCYTVEAEALYDDQTILGDQTPSLMFAFSEKATAYIQSCRLSQDASDLGAPWVHVLKTGEGQSTTELTQSDVVLIRQLPGAPAGVDMAKPIIQLLRNPIMTRWPTRVDSLSAFTTDRPLAANWRSFCSGATMTVTKTALTAAQTLLFPFQPLYSMRIESSGADFAGVTQPWYGPAAIAAARTMSRGGDIILRIYGLGEMPASLRATITVNGSAYAAGVAFPRVPTTETSAWSSEVRLTPGDLPVDLSAVTTFVLFIDCGTSTAAYDYQLVGAFMFPSGCASNMDFTEPFEPPLPSPYVLARITAAASHTGNTTETALATVTVPGQALGSTGMLKITASWSGNNGADTKTIRHRFSTITGTAFHSQALGATIQSALVVSYIQNLTSATQKGGISAASTTGVGTSTAAIPTASVNTAVNTTIVLSGQLANGADTVTLEGYVVELYPDE